MRKLIAFLVLICTQLISACATQGTSGTTPAGNAAVSAPGKGIIYLAVHYDPVEERIHSLAKQRAGGRNRMPGREAPRYPVLAVARARDDRDRELARSVLPVYPGDLLVQRLKEGLTAAGYTVVVKPRLLPQVDNGIAITAVAADITYSSGLLQTQGECRLDAKLEVWRNGAPVQTLPRQAKVSGYTFFQRDRLCLSLLTDAARKVADEMRTDLGIAPGH